MNTWTWVILAWAELIVFYVGYLFYLNWRANRAKDKK
jgi:hypothetical protein